MNQSSSTTGNLEYCVRCNTYYPKDIGHNCGAVSNRPSLIPAEVFNISTMDTTAQLSQIIELLTKICEDLEVLKSRK